MEKYFGDAFHGTKQCLINMLIRDGKLLKQKNTKETELSFIRMCRADETLKSTWLEYSLAVARRLAKKDKVTINYRSYRRWFSLRV